MAVAHAFFARSGGSKTRDGTRRGGRGTRAASRTVGGRVANAGTARGESHRLATMGSRSRPQGRGARMKLSLSAKGRRADARERDARAGRASAPPSSQRCEARYPARVPGGREHVGGRGAKSPDRAENLCAQAPVSKQKQPHRGKSAKKCKVVLGVSARASRAGALTEVCTPVFEAAQFTMGKRQRRPECPSMDSDEQGLVHL